MCLTKSIMLGTMIAGTHADNTAAIALGSGLKCVQGEGWTEPYSTDMEEGVEECYAYALG